MRIRRGRPVVNALIIIGLMFIVGAAVVASEGPTKVEAANPR